MGSDHQLAVNILQFVRQRRNSLASGRRSPSIRSHHDVEKVGIGQEAAHALGARSLGGYQHFFACVVIVPPHVCKPDAGYVICGVTFSDAVINGSLFLPL